jgi:hypothetical protein
MFTINGIELPDLPPALPSEDSEARNLFLFTWNNPSEMLLGSSYPYGVSLEDARDYCSREDTHGDGWFVGFDRW